MGLLEMLAEVMESIGEDAASPVPGLFTLATIIRLLECRGYPGKGKDETLSPRQRAEVKRMLDRYYEKRVIGRQRLYGSRIG